jgi:hypothetical protein
MERTNFGATLRYTGRIYNVKPLSKGTAFAVRVSSKSKTSGEYNSVFINCYYGGDAILQDKADYIIEGNILVDDPYKERPAQMKLFVKFVEPMSMVQGSGAVDRTQTQSKKYDF